MVIIHQYNEHRNKGLPWSNLFESTAIFTNYISKYNHVGHWLTEAQITLRGNLPHLRNMEELRGSKRLCFLIIKTPKITKMQFSNDVSFIEECGQFCCPINFVQLTWSQRLCWFGSVQRSKTFLKYQIWYSTCQHVEINL